ncbi:RAMP superfamily CRISPR-associated protein [Aliarcobacter skirrowii]|uniref:RAMP superfamily CRISPR-associated protein n=1 Tax=Aliarcobacter skirrowii TaxID=28200 RepID=UPI0029ABBA4E|nr:RAMP superfamily CRISPR-associated protein [Aliarcobacter skirrowii]MDX4050739.1 RAMP superfamily CRISPR-associated protein [Aliarcobacter skirrowii]
MKNIFIAYIIFEAKTALKIGSKNADFLQDSPIQKDWNGLPMILGTSLAGVLRKEFDEVLSNKFFGTGDLGSKTIISNALLLDENQKVNESLLLDSKKSEFLQKFIVLPIREHNAMNDKGVTIKNAKFDEEVIYKGTRFKFSIEMLNENEDDKNNFFRLLDLLSKDSFRIGAGSSKGFGQIKVIEITYDEFDVNSDEYVNLSSSLNTNLSKTYEIKEFDDKKYIKYELKLTPDDFFMFGSGFMDDEANMTPVYEKIIDYKKQDLSEEKILIPASSVKGAISHRTTYYYNLLNNKFINKGGNADIVESIFGAKKDKDKAGFKGNILISDVCLEKNDTKVFEHVSIDRFTGGAIDSALFQEKTVASKEEFTLEILIHKENIKKECKKEFQKREKEEIKKQKEESLEEYEKKIYDAFEKALKDITIGMLSLGGATTKGHGIFSGKVLKNGVEI